VSPEERVPTEQSAWGRLDVDAIMSHLSADAVWRNVAIRALRGYDEIREAVQGYLNRMTDAEMDILNLAGAGNVVHTERVGHLGFNFAIWPPLHRTLSWVRDTTDGPSVGDVRHYYDKTSHGPATSQIRRISVTVRLPERMRFLRAFRVGPAHAQHMGIAISDAPAHSRASKKAVVFQCFAKTSIEPRGH
jgi:hypothetical protein